MLIKICGLTREEEADYLNKNKVDFAGFVLFFPKSKRNITIEKAEKIMERLDESIKKVAVVVTPGFDQIRQVEEAGFDYIQIHGEPNHVSWDQIKIPVIKAFNISDMENFAVYQQIEQIKGYVFDAHEPGSGKAFDWNLLKSIPKDGKMRFLAGGLSAENVRKAILATCPDGVDVSSGVEREHGQGKDKDKINQFVKEVRECAKCGRI